ncbi:MAG: hypothetical protein OXC19_12345 [Bryobacterales bacterium]|nr:hypothetical protein [Bryobacterales bacterium]
MTDARANRRRYALEAACVLRYQWTPRTDSQDDVEETATRLWRAREEASWEALRRRLATSFATTETEHTRQWRRVLGRQKARKNGLQSALEGEPSRVPLCLRRLWWWLGLRSAGSGGIRTASSGELAPPGAAGEEAAS